MATPHITPLHPSPYKLVRRTLPQEGLTPSRAYERLRGQTAPLLLESVKGSPQTARYSLLPGPSFLTLSSRGSRVRLVDEEGNERLLQDNPLKVLKDLLNRYRLPSPPGFPPFIGGAVGYFAYDICHFFERLPCNTVDDLGLPEIYLFLVDSGVIFDRLRGEIHIFSTGMRRPDPRKALALAHEWVESAQAAIAVPAEGERPFSAERPPDAVCPGGMESNFTQRGFEKVVRRAKEYIRAGDIFQVNLSQRLQSPVRGSYWELYKSLRAINPSPFACYLEGDGFSVVSCSPERLVRIKERRVDTRPIAGTRPRGKTGREDKALCAELLLNEKERAEHIMLVDLERNDLGRICEYGSVEVNELMALEDYSHVFHIVSNVRGRLLAGKDCFSVLRACFPGGTITGTPKIRSMEIIDELEPTRRGLYTGSMGYISFSRDMDLNIVIRTFVIKDNTAYVQVGCGIVADSDPEREYWETLHKAQALVQSLRFHSLSP